jgi:ADP-ribose pyrophosphatase YjhB (NUDIX family)
MRFNIRVYGLILNSKGEVLLSNEKRHGYSFTKFPGGGLEWGEGLKEGLKREIMEEIGKEAEIGDLIYVNDFFQRSAFRDSDQIISFYFKVFGIEESSIDLRTLEERGLEEGEAFEWVKPDDQLVEKLTFPIDRVVAQQVF